MTFRYLFLLLLAFSATGASAATPLHHSTQRDFSYKRSDCPFDAVGLNALNLQCGYLTVPENREKNDGRRISLAVAVIKAPKQDSGNTAVVLLEGGPGGEALRPAFLRGARMLLPHRDLVVVDQRGVGYSKPSLCTWFDATGSAIGAMNLTENQARYMVDGAYRACHDELRARGVDLSAYNVIENAADINDLRRALGYAKWNLVGGSYGGTLEQVEIRDYPAGVRSAVLFSPVPIGMLGGDNVWSFARSLEKVFALCKDTEECARTYPGLKRKFYAVIQSLHGHPLKVDAALPGLRRQSYVFNSQDFVNLIFNMLHNENGVSHLPAIVSAFYRRDRSAVSKSASTWLDGNDRFAMGMFESDVCYDAPVSRSHWQTEAAHHPDLKSIGFWNEPCGYWESERATPAQLRAVKSNIPALVVNGGLDPIMPPRFDRKVLDGLPHARHIFLPDSTHSQGGRSMRCLGLVVDAFLADPSSPLDVSCVKKIPPLRFRALSKK